MLVIFNLTKCADAVQLLDQLLARFKPVQTLIPLRYIFIQGGMLIKDVQQFQIMAAANFKVIEIMCRGDFHRPSAFFHIGIAVSHNRYLPAHNRQHNHLANQCGIAFIIRMHSDRHVAEHGFRARGRDCDHLVRSLDRIMQLPHFPCHIFLFHLQIRNRSQ